LDGYNKTDVTILSDEALYAKLVGPQLYPRGKLQKIYR